MATPSSDYFHLAKRVEASFIAEASALKPGNVHPFAPGHDMEFSDFEQSARLVSPILCQPDSGVGERIYLATEVVMREIGCNTNLGMLLLFAPLIRAFESIGSNDPVPGDLQTALKQILASLHVEDTRYIYKAIRTANPGGLGETKAHDVRDAPQISILEAMQLASERDLIAMQYVTDFEDIFVFGIGWLEQGLAQWNRLDWAIVLCYLNFLSRYPDSHIARKFGENYAEEVRQKSAAIAVRFSQANDPDVLKPELLRLDSELKAANLNPGTTADITAASILVCFMTSEKFWRSADYL